MKAARHARDSGGPYVPLGDQLSFERSESEPCRSGRRPDGHSVPWWYAAAAGLLHMARQWQVRSQTASDRLGADSNKLEA